MPEIGLIAVTAVIAIVLLSNIGLKAVASVTIPVALAILLRRQDHGTGYTNAARTLFLMLRYNIAAAYGSMDFSLRRHLQLDRQEMTGEEEEDGQQAKDA